MLTEGAAGDLAAKPPYRSHQASPDGEEPSLQASGRRVEEGKPALNPFRGAQNIGKNSLEAAVDIFKSFGGGTREEREAPSREAPETRAAETPKPATRVRGDLFDDHEDADLEIPSFLRKKKTG